MAQRRPATAGDAIDAIETPALCVDLAAFERNLDAMATNVAAAGLRLRPHAKSHKCPAIAKAQIDRGAVGICCQKTDEALAFVAAGIKDVLVTNEVVAPRKLERLALAAADARIGLLVDNAIGAHRASEAASAAAATFDVYVEIDVGAHRCGVHPAAAGELAALMRGLPCLRFGGLHCYHGAAQHLRTRAARQEAIVAAQARVREALGAVQARGIACPIITGAGTGTFPLERDSGVWNELQPGSYVFMDADYGRNQLGAGDLRFEHALFVLSSVMSVPAAGRAICDAGLKAFSLDSGLPLVHARDGVSYAKATDEHGVLEVDPRAAPLRLDDRIRLTPGHCDPTVNLYDWIVGVRGDEVACVWEVAARGAVG
jgi:D-serine deaminase-like pyridoxal phosphate-dependent protein